MYSDESFSQDVLWLDKLASDQKQAVLFILRGGYDSLSYPQYPTGIIPGGIYRAASGINVPEGVSVSERLGYINQTLLYHRQQNFQKLYNDDSDNARFLYLNSYRKIGSYEEFADMEVETLAGYGFPATYSTLISDDDNAIPDCSRDVILDRLSNGQFYNRGIEFVFPKSNLDTHFFYIDRKANTLFRAQHLKKVLENDYFKFLLPTNESLSGLKADLADLLKKLTTTQDPILFITKIIDFMQRHRFSTVSAAMFDLAHLFINHKLQSIVQSNRVMQHVDAQLKSLWTMRGFYIPSLTHLDDVLSRYDINLNDFAQFIKDRFLNEMYQYLGAQPDGLDDLVLDNLFYESIFSIEASGCSLDPTYEPVTVSDDAKIPEGLSDLLYFDTKSGQMIFRQALTIVSQDILLPLLSKIFTKNNPTPVEAAIKTHLLKLAYFHTKESIGAEILRIIKLNKAGYLATTFQSDNRGEYFLLANIPENGYQAHKVHVDITDKTIKLSRVQTIDTSFTVKSYSYFDPSINYFLPENNLFTSKISRHKKFNYLFSQYKDLLSDRFRNLLFNIKEELQNQHVVVAFPFFKEHNVLIQHVLQCIKFHAGSTLHILLISNLPPDDFEIRISQVQAAIDKLPPTNVYLYPINTSEINQLNIWMSNKLLTFKLMVELYQLLVQSRLNFTKAYLMESDIFNSADWWKKLSEITIEKEEIVLLDYSVQCRLEGGPLENTTPRVDVKENIFYKLIEKPLTSILFGREVGAIMGSSYGFGSKAIDVIAQINQSSPKAQSIESLIISAFDYISVRTVNVGNKIHYASSVIDERFGYRVLGFVEGIVSNLGKLLRVRVNLKHNIVIGIDEGLASALESSEFRTAYDAALETVGHFSEVYAELLGRERAATMLSQIKSRGFQPLEWLEVIIRSILLSQTVGPNTLIEYLASLQPLAVLMMPHFATPGITIQRDQIINLVESLIQAGTTTVQSSDILLFTDSSQRGKDYLLSDIQGEYEAFCHLLVGLGLIDDAEDPIINVPMGSNLIIAGDLVDCYSRQPESYARACLKKISMDRTIDREGLLQSLRCVFRSSVDSLENLDYGTLSKQPHDLQNLIAAYKTYLLANTVMVGQKINNSDPSKGNIFVLLGNHEADLLSGKIYYRSLQKTFLLNMLGISGTFEHEWKDKVINSAPRFQQGKIVEFRNEPERFIGSVELLRWINSFPTAVVSRGNLVMHAGPGEELLDAINNGSIKSVEQICTKMFELRSAAIERDGIYQAESIYDLHRNISYLVDNTYRLVPMLNLLNCKFLAVGHSPYLVMQALGIETNDSNIEKHPYLLSQTGLINDRLIKLDGAVKYDANNMSAVIVDNELIASVDNQGVKNIYNGKEKSHTSHQQIQKAIGIDKALKQLLDHDYH